MDCFASLAMTIKLASRPSPAPAAAAREREVESEAMQEAAPKGRIASLPSFLAMTRPSS
jgi:hypothetical protein